MSDPYNQPPPNYGSPAPTHQQYGQQYDQSQVYNQQAYGQQTYPPATPSYSDAPASYGPPQRVNSYGPPQHGGFQHGQQGGQYGAYDASNPQGQSDYYVAPPQGGYGAQTDPSNPNQHPQHGYSQSPYPQDPNAPPNQQMQQHGYQDPNMPPHDPNAPYDPNAPEGERGLGGAIAGGLAGHFAGNRMGNHGFLGLIGGAIAGSKLQDKYKGKNVDSHHSSSSHHSSGGSSWGGGYYEL